MPFVQKSADKVCLSAHNQDCSLNTETIMANQILPLIVDIIYLVSHGKNTFRFLWQDKWNNKWNCISCLGITSYCHIIIIFSVLDISFIIGSGKAVWGHIASGQSPSSRYCLVQPRNCHVCMLQSHIFLTQLYTHCVHIMRNIFIVTPTLILVVNMHCNKFTKYLDLMNFLK